jgi:hypothetical protein
LVIELAPGALPAGAADCVEPALVAVLDVPLVAEPDDDGGVEEDVDGAVVVVDEVVAEEVLVVEELVVEELVVGGLDVVGDVVAVDELVVGAVVDVLDVVDELVVELVGGGLVFGVVEPGPGVGGVVADAGLTTSDF